MIIATIMVGVIAGLGGMCLAILLHGVQHLAFGYSDEAFLLGVQAASADRRVVILIICGVLAGIGWWAIRRYGKPLVSIHDAVINGQQMPAKTTIAHVLLQIVTVGLGSPLGREVAPRELGTLLARWIGDRAGVSARNAQILMACGAGAGLAAVYNVPLAGAVFVLEAVLMEFSVALFLRALVVTCIAVAVSWIGLGNHPAYNVMPMSISYSLVVWSVVAGPILGFGGFWFIRAATSARRWAQPNWQTPLFCFVNFTMIGLLAINYPALLGNGKSPVQLAFDNGLGISLTATLLVLRIVLPCTTLRAGAFGGLLTPSLASGALLALMLAYLWQLIWPGAALNSFALVGATAFLAAAQSIPFTSVILMFEFTRVDWTFVIPMVLCIAGAVMTAKACQQYVSPPQ